MIGMMLYAAIAATTIGLACLVNNQTQTVVGQFHITKGLTRRQGMNSLSLLAIFTILFLLSALRIEVGNDYETYVDTFHEIYVGGYVVTEPLFNAVVKIICELSNIDLNRFTKILSYVFKKSKISSIKSFLDIFLNLNIP